MNTLTVPSAAEVTGRHEGLLRTIARLTAVELRLMLREPGVLVSLIAFPAVTVLVLAGVFGSDPDPDFGGVIPSEHYVVGYVGVVLASLGLVTLPAHLASHRELGVLRRYRAAGLDARAVVGSHIALGAVLGTVASAVVLLIGGVAYGVPTPDDPTPRRGVVRRRIAVLHRHRRRPRRGDAEQPRRHRLRQPAVRPDVPPRGRRPAS